MPASVDVKLNEALVELVKEGGFAVMVVYGAAVSTVHVYEAGVASVFPAESVARTLNMCEPSARPL